MARSTRSQKQRVVRGKHGPVGIGGAYPRLVELAVDLAAVVLEDPRELTSLRRVLQQHDPTDDFFDVGVREGDLDGKASLELLQLLGGLQGGLAGGDEQQPPLKARGAGLDHVLDAQGAVGVVPEVLLQLVEHEQGTRRL